MQLINIKYNVDKSTVDESNKSVEKARDLTDQLKKSSQQYSETASKGNKQFLSSIESVKLKMAQLRAQIDLTSRSDTKRLNDLIGQYKKAKSEVDHFNKSLEDTNKISKQASTNSRGLAGGFMDMYNAIKLVVGAQLVRELVTASLEMAKLQGQTEAVGRAFSTQIPNSEALLYRLQVATKGTVSDMELMQRALKFKNFGGDLDALPKLLQFAQVRAQQTGEDVDYLVNSIVDGLGRKSVRVLDNLGISASRIKEEFHGVGLESLSVAELTKGFGNIVDQELKKMGEGTENAATKVDQITVAWHELRIELAKRLDTSAILDFYKEVLSGAKTFIQAFPKLDWKNLIPFYGQGKFFKDFQKNIDDITMSEFARNEAIKQFTEFQGEANKEADKGITLAQKTIVGNVERINQNNAEIKSWTKKNELLEEHSYLNQEQIKEGKRAIKYYEGQNAKLDKYNELLGNFIVEGSKATVVAKKLNDEFEDHNKKHVVWKKKPWDLTNWKKDFGLDKIFPKDNKIVIPVEFEVRDTGNYPLKKPGFLSEFMDKNKNEFYEMGINNTADVLNTIYNMEVVNYEKRIDALGKYYDKLGLMAGDNDRYRKELALREQRDTEKMERELAVKQKRARKFSIAIDTAASIARAWINPGYPGAIPLTAFLIAQGVTQAAIVEKSTPGFKDGVINLQGPGTGKSDSINANLSKGESVITADATQSSVNTLKMIQAKKLDDRKLERIISKAKGSDGAIVDFSTVEAWLSRIASNTQGSDFAKKGAVLMEIKKEQVGITKIIRAKTING